MSKVLILGAGMVVKPMVDYLLEKGVQVTLASRTKSKADAIINGRDNAEAIAWTVDQAEELEAMIQANDLTVSLLPYTFHVTVAELCIKHGKNMVTTSYVSEQMKALDEQAKDAGIIILNEIGLDPGIDHMTAQQIIDNAHDRDAKIEEFYSICGALPAPEASQNPLRYKFSWSPKGVVMASNNGAKFLKDGIVQELDTIDLFKNPIQENFPELETLEIYPNRDSLSYVDIYNIPETKTMYRGTFRYKNWCESLDSIKALGMTGYDKVDASGLSYKEFTAKISGLASENIKAAIANELNIEEAGTAINAMEWLGLFDDKQLPYEEEVSPFDVLSDLMIEKMMLGDDERDMVAMQHTFVIEEADGTRKEVKSRLLDFGNEEDTSIARTVALPAAIGVEMILNGQININGVHIPIRKEIYEPVLTQLETMGIGMKEEVREISQA
ncbi:saccharopine dehydrogenase-like NADP-dependent oxidoreductase [Aureibacter tunicatorum]|uniref:Saccharopine dehydrogenase-like NADP-dependent oxidoreductase n=2 Tax=Aureibacter tunicatorum TaxID=866807 RepID=A0AAE4BUP7_9BACT|nr:saccharopine dehydrogenase-like NADP-dependent oxidoreductase [Aureibacter tunicatorum]BDD07276.1 saccharopine dehydrogenase [Aureibacter tunicatorum]